MHRWIFLLLTFLFVETAGGENVPGYSLERRPLPLQPQEAEFWNAHCEQYRKWMNVLIIEGSRTSLDLAETASCLDRVHPEGDHRGLNPEKITIGWLDPGKLLWIRWRTFFLGSGGYVYDGHLVVVRDGRKLTKVFQTTFPSSASVGLMNYSHTSMEIRFDSTSSVLTIRQTQVDSGSRRSNPKAPLFVRHEMDNGVIYVREKKVFRQWAYILQDTHLTYANGFEYADLGEREHPLREVSEGFNIETPKLIALNPRQRSGNICAGAILLDNALAPYQGPTMDPLYGDKGRPPWR